MEIISCGQAKEKGLKKYFTGVPCSKNHICERYTSNNKCLECNKEQARLNHYIYFEKKQAKQKQYYEENKDKILAINAQWALDNPDKVKETHKRWRDNNPLKLKEWDAQWRKANPDKSRNRLNEWRRDHPAKYRMQKYRRRMLEVLAEGSFTEDDLIIMLEQQNGLCLGPNCETEIVDTFTVDHKVPLSRGGNNDPDNLQLLCRSCNSAKGIQTDDEWRNTDPTGL